jgi:hypothetical protein
LRPEEPTQSIVGFSHIVAGVAALALIACTVAIPTGVFNFFLYFHIKKFAI